MIKADFYPDYQTYSDNLILTDTLSNQHVTTKTDDPLRAYYMGKLPNNKCRSLLWKSLKIVGTGDDKPNMTISLEADENRSMNWGYCMSSQTTPSRMYWTSGNAYAWDCKLINSMQAYCLTTGGNVQITFYLYDFTDYTLDSGATIKGAGIFRGYSPQLTSTEYVNWMENGTDLNLTFTDYGTITIKSQDCNENGIWELGNNKYIIMHQIATDCGTTYTGMSSGSYINPFYCTTARSDGRFHAFSNLQRWELLQYRIRFTLDFSDVRLYVGLGDTAYTASGTGAGIVSKSRDISVSAEALDYARRQSENTYTMFGDKQTIMQTALSITIDGKTFYQAEMVYNIMPNDAYFTYCLINKAKNGNPNYSSTYTTAHTVGIFNASNEPTGKRSFVTTYPALEPSLQKWQRYGYNINDDEYNPEVIPPTPRPDPVPPDDDENGGDDYEPNDPSGLGVGTGFTTMYAIRSTHLQQLGNKLWNGFTDINNYINNFVFAVDPNTGSVNFADIMQFFISLRAYPCPVSVMASTSAGGQDMYIGSGAAPIHLNTNFSIVDDYIGTINAGELTVPFWFGDYRDYSLECIVYLPYCGTAELNAGDIMGGKLSAFYTVDFCTGACMAYVLCDTWDGTRIRVASLSGQLGADLPLTATNAGQVAARMYGDRINVAENILGGVKSAVTGIGAVASGNFAGAVRQGFDAFITPSLNEERLKSQMGTRSAIAAPMLSAGRGLASFTDAKTVFLQIRSPIYAAPSNYNATVGQPATDAVTIGDCSGFCQFINVDVSGITTDAEDQRAIRQALETGVII